MAKKQKKLSIAFFGTPELSVYVLEELCDAGHEPALIVTMPDAPRDRNLILTPPPAKVWADQRGIEVLQPASFREKDIAAFLNSEWDLFVVAAYGKILPKHVIELPKYGTLNVHPSLLPALRGPSPIRSAILEDSRETGVTIMCLDEEMDHGPIVAQARVELDEKEWPPRGRVLDEILMRAGGELLAEIIPAWISGEIEPEAQDHDRATYSERITREMGEIDLSGDAYQNLLKIRAFDGWPGTYFYTERNRKRIRVKIVDAELEDDTLNILRVIPEGKKEMDYRDFIRDAG